MNSNAQTTYGKVRAAIRAIAPAQRIYSLENAFRVRIQDRVIGTMGRYIFFSRPRSAVLNEIRSKRASGS